MISEISQGRQIPYDFTHVESKERTELTRKMGTDSWMESRMTASGGGVEGVEGWSKKEKDSWTWTTMWSLLGGGDIRRLNGNGKNTTKIKCKIKVMP